MTAVTFPSGAFCLSQVALAPRWLRDREIHAFDVAVPELRGSGCALVETSMLVLDDEELRRWIVRQLNLVVTGVSYGTACLELLHGFRVSPPPRPVVGGASRPPGG